MSNVIPKRLYDGNHTSKIGDIVEVFGWYNHQEWVKVVLTKHVGGMQFLVMPIYPTQALRLK